MGACRSTRGLRHLTLLCLSVTGFALTAANASAVTPKITAGLFHTCALLSDGTVQCFGSNATGALGNSTNVATSAPNPTPAPTAPLGLPAVDIGAGQGFTCALLIDGTVTCFGINNAGQLGTTTGNGATAAHPTPAPTAALGAPAIAISVGANHACAVLENSSVQCWGSNYYGQLGNTATSGSAGANPTPASTLALGAPAVAVAAGGAHTCVLLNNGGVTCFGSNSLGQLGSTLTSGTLTPNPTPTPTLALGAPATAIAAGLSHTCAVLGDGTVKCFGYNQDGQLGALLNSATPTPNPTPMATIPLGAQAIALAGGNHHTCVLLIDGTLKCFGSNQQGQLGRSTNTGQMVANPTPEATLPLGGPANAVAVGGDHTCVILVDGTLRCFGYNSYGQIGSGLAGYSYLPLTPPGLQVNVPQAPPAVPAPPAGKLQAKFAKPKFKSKTKGKKIVLSSTVGVSAPGLVAAGCQGTLRATVQLKKQRLARKSFALRYAKGKCVAAVKLSIAKKYDDKRLKVTLAVADSTTLAATSTAVTKKL